MMNGKNRNKRKGNYKKRRKCNSSIREENKIKKKGFVKKKKVKLDYSLKKRMIYNRRRRKYLKCKEKEEFK